MAERVLTVVRHGVDPLVQGRVELSNNTLLPLLPDEAQQRLRLVDRVLSSRRELFLPLRNTKARTAHDGAHRKHEDLLQAQEAVEEREFGRLPRWLLERGACVARDPALVIALRRHVGVEAVNCLAPDEPETIKIDNVPPDQAMQIPRVASP